MRGIRGRVDAYFRAAMADAARITRQGSPLQTELWASLLTSAWLPEVTANGRVPRTAEVAHFIERGVARGDVAAGVMLAALAVVGAPEEVAAQAAQGADRLAEVVALPEWATRMGRVRCEGAWYGGVDPYGDQDLAVLSFCYDNGAEPHVVAVLIDHINGGFAVDAFTDGPTFVETWCERRDAGQLRPVQPGDAAGRILDAFHLTDRVLGAPVSETLEDERSFVLARARTIPDPVKPVIAEPASNAACADLARRFWTSPHATMLDEVDGAEEAFELLLSFVGGWPEDRLLWWSPTRASVFLTDWLPRKAIMSDEAVSAMVQVVMAWTHFAGADLSEQARAAIFRQIDEDVVKLPALITDPAQAGLAKQIALGREPDLSYLFPDQRADE
jgi:hypothetical protein